ncbi:MAG: PH domain-containing protein [Anaerolineae bacterium]|nr:PH domain-containing protein [Anaerolineae bacterium]
MMKARSVAPDRKYLFRMRLIATIVALAILAGGILLGLILALTGEIRLGGAMALFIVAVILNGLWWLIALILSGPYYRSLRYEIQDDEVVVYAGIWTKSVKHVPYRTVTNLQVKRDIVDRWLGLGTLNIQTAGMSGQTGVEERLVGLSGVQEVYEVVAEELRRFRGGMAPTQADVEVEPEVAPQGSLGEILAELRAIRKSLEAR